MYAELHHKAFLLLLALVTIAFVWVLLPFYGAVFWATVLAIVFRPLQRGLERTFVGRKSLCAVLSVIVCVVIAVLPVMVVLASLLSEGAAVVERIQNGELALPASMTEVYSALPAWAQASLDRLGLSDFGAVRDRLAAAIGQASQFMAGQALNVGQNTLSFFASLGIMLYVLFFLFRDGPQIARVIRDSLPLSRDHGRTLIAKFTAVIRATVKGNVIIAVLQGGIGGLAFWALGIPGALVWSVAMMFLSMLPAIGAAIVWAPAAGYLFLSGDYLRGGILVFVGVAVIGLVDNLLRPPLVGKETRLPDYIVLVSTLGGLAVFGLNGFVIGPLVAALFLSGWTLFRDERNAAQGREAGETRT